MKKTIIASVLAALLSTTALADTSSLSATSTGMGVLENEWVKAGVNGTSGTFGSGGNTSPGLLFDPTGTGTFDPSYDYLTPGSPFDGFAVKVDGTNYSNNNGRSNSITGTGLTDGTNTLSWSGGVTGVFDITNTYTLAPATPYIDITSSITMGVSATTLSFGRHIDPDSQGMPGDSSSTDNVLGYGVIPSTNIAFSEATVSRYALGIYTTDTNVTAGINGWSQEADGYNGTSYTDADGNNVLYGNSDDTIGISWTWTGVSAGDILTANYAYIFGPSAFDAADDAITGGAGGGADTSSWGTLTDVGSATDAASGSGTPAPVITTDTIVDTSRPVLTASITHHTASDDGAVQTIDREKTETVTTPMRTVTYTDGVETSSVVATSVIATTVTDPGSFTGRIDQVATAQDVVGSSLRGLSFDGVSGIGMRSTMDNGMSGTTRGFQAGGKKQGDDGMIIGFGGAQMSTTLTGNGDSVEADTTVISATIGRSLEKGDVELNVRHAMTDFTVERTVGDYVLFDHFTNQSSYKGTDTSVSLRFKADGEKIRPIFGYTRGKRTTDAYSEIGSIQSARTVGETSDMYGYATVGGELDLGLLNITALHHTDGVNDVIVSVEKETDKLTWNVRAHRSMTDLGDTNSLSAGISWKF